MIRRPNNERFSAPVREISKVFGTTTAVMGAYFSAEAAIKAESMSYDRETFIASTIGFIAIGSRILWSIHKPGPEENPERISRPHDPDPIAPTDMPSDFGALLPTSDETYHSADRELVDA